MDSGILPPVLGSKTIAFLCSLTLLSFDYLLTLRYEIALVWSRKWAAGTALFFLNRYLPFADSVMIYRALHSTVGVEDCIKIDKIIAWMSSIGVAISEVILIMRTLALWNGNIWVAAILATTFIGAVVGSVVSTGWQWTDSIHYPESVSQGPGCDIETSSNSFLVSIIVILILETVIVLLTALRARYHIHHTSSGWLVALYQQGFVFYLCMLGMTILNLIWPLVGTPTIAYDNTLFVHPLRVLHSIFCNRVFFIIFHPRPPQHHSFLETRSRFFGTGGEHEDGAATRSVALVESTMMTPSEWFGDDESTYNRTVYLPEHIGMEQMNRNNDSNSASKTREPSRVDQTLSVPRIFAKDSSR